MDILNPGLQTIELPFAGVGIRQAQLDGQPASIHRDGAKTLLFVEGPARRKLKLQMVAPVLTDLALQTLRVTVPRPPTTAIQMTVPATWKSNKVRR